MGCHFLLQGIFLTQGSNSGLSHCRQTVYCWNHQGILQEDGDLLLCVLLPSTVSGTWTFDGSVNTWMKKWNMHREQGCSSLIISFPVLELTDFPKTFPTTCCSWNAWQVRSWSALSHSKEWERADRSVMKLSLILKSIDHIVETDMVSPILHQEGCEKVSWDQLASRNPKWRFMGIAPESQKRVRTYSDDTETDVSAQRLSGWDH